MITNIMGQDSFVIVVVLNTSTAQGLILVIAQASTLASFIGT